MYTVSLKEASISETTLVGGKSRNLALLKDFGITVPRSLCITTKAYNDFLNQGKLREKIALELNRKKFDDMRWEEIWDAALRIRKLFVNTRLPNQLENSLKNDLHGFFGDHPVAVRSSAPEEDTAEASFAGLHESFLNISGIVSIIDHIKKVWASLWSDAALLYKQELGLDPVKSSIAVLVQEIITSEVSGVMFSRNPNNNQQVVIEAVYGLNQGLVDGTVEPDRWNVRIKDNELISHTAVERNSKVIPADQGVLLATLSDTQKKLAPLTSDQVLELAGKAIGLEEFFGKPQDIEWTLAGSSLYILQSRPITTTTQEDPQDQRSWHLSLRRSFNNLKVLHKRIADDLLPEMDAIAKELAAITIENLSNEELSEEIIKRNLIHNKWVDIYWEDFIPFAHGMRLYGQVYNDRIRPDDPYEFITLLSMGSLASIQRNELLLELGRITAASREIQTLLEQNRPFDVKDPLFLNSYEKLQDMFGDLQLSLGDNEYKEGPEGLVCSTILKMAQKLPILRSTSSGEVREKLEKNYFAAFSESAEKRWAEELLELGRASYTFRDDDNIYLGRIEKQLNRAVHEARKRLKNTHGGDTALMDFETVAACLKDPGYKPVIVDSKRVREENLPQKDKTTRARQLLGQPAGPGVVRGIARVVTEPSHLKELQQGEILVCESIDPNMTFIIPLVGGIVERRGGMLIHGAIIAREYGLACVTGIPDATTMINTGDTITVDGYLGIVTISHVQDPLA